MGNSSSRWLARAAAVRNVFIDDSDQDQDEPEHTKYVRKGRQLVAGAQERGERLVQRQQRKGRGERNEQPVVGAPPKPKKKSCRDEKPQRHGAGKEVDDDAAHSASQMNA